MVVGGVCRGDAAPPPPNVPIPSPQCQTRGVAPADTASERGVDCLESTPHLRTENTEPSLEELVGLHIILLENI